MIPFSGFTIPSFDLANTIHPIEIIQESEAQTSEPRMRGESTLNQKINSGQKRTPSKTSTVILFAEIPSLYIPLKVLTKRVIFYCAYLL